jgi:hypothetical protein
MKGEFVMKVRVINQELSDFDHDFKVKNINYDMVVVEDDKETVPFSMEDVELIPENKYDNLILEYKDILKIKLGKYISMELYAALINFVEEEISGKLKTLDVLKDEFNINKRGIWEKKLVIVANDYVPFDVNIIGEKYSRKFSITFKEIALENFIKGCTEGIELLKKEIEEKEKDIKVYRRAVKNVLEHSVDICNSCENKLIAGM